MLTYDQCCFVYCGLIRTGHKKSLKVSILRSNPSFNTVFSFKPFTTPCFVASMVFLVKKISFFSPALKFDDPAIPQKKQFRSCSYTAVGKLQGVIAAFYTKEPHFAAATIDYPMDKCVTDPVLFNHILRNFNEANSAPKRQAHPTSSRVRQSTHNPVPIHSRNRNIYPRSEPSQPPTPAP